MPEIGIVTLELEDWEDVPFDCGRTLPGVGHGNPRVLDLSARDTTEDQKRIEDVLDTLLTPNARVLHVGVGNSSLARRFADRTRCILGLTLSEAEKLHGDSLGLPGYAILSANKYSEDLSTIEGPFDLIIDNNPASFACCLRHFEIMLGQYARLLAVDGRILTDREGMYWCYDNGPMRLRFEHLEAISRSYPFTAERITHTVFALRRNST